MTTSCAMASGEGDRPLHVIVADDHHHILPEIHLAIRRRRLPFDGIHLVHLDAHPDLSFPRNVNADIVYKPNELYDCLDESVAGIAEFLLPLVYAGHVSQMTWIKPKWAAQMACGQYPQLAVERLCLSYPGVHFIEDETYCPLDEMDPQTVKFWDLFVDEFQRQSDSTACSTLEGSTSLTGKPCILDIDLDYFSTWNPFLKELEEFLCDEERKILRKVFIYVRYRDPKASLTATERVDQKKQFTSACERLHQEQLYYSYESEECQLLLDTLLSLYDDTIDCKDLLQQFCKLLARKEASMVEKIFDWGPCLDLPHHETSSDDIALMLDELEQYIEKSGLSPWLVTIAKSVGDEFLPPHQVDDVLDAVMQLLERQFGRLDVNFIQYD